MSNKLKQKVLSAFRDIHRARFQVFKGDQNALAITRVEINKRYLDFFVGSVFFHCFLL